METIINYLDNMFAALPKTKQVTDLKEDIFSNMDDKYNELIRSGRTESEAIGIVISEFGNIDELISELGFERNDGGEVLPVLTEDAVNEYLRANKRSGVFMGTGVFLCIFGSALLILINQLTAEGFVPVLREDTGNRYGVVLLLLFIAAAAGILIYSAMSMDQFKNMNGRFEITSQVKYLIEKRTESYRASFVRAFVIAVILCVLSPAALLIAPFKLYGTAIVLFVISFSAFIFTYYGWNQISYKKLLEIKNNKRNPFEKIRDTLSGALWIFITAAFVAFTLWGWRFSWVIFLFGAGFQVLIEAYYQSKNGKI